MARRTPQRIRIDTKPYRVCRYQKGTPEEHLMLIPMGRSREHILAKYEAKTFCNAVCYRMHRYSQIPEDRYCACGKPIPRQDKYGKEIQPNAYARRKTCGDSDCIVSRRKKTKASPPKAKRAKVREWYSPPDLIEQFYLRVAA